MHLYLYSTANKENFTNIFNIRLSLDISPFKYVKLTAKEITNIKTNILCS